MAEAPKSDRQWAAELAFAMARDATDRLGQGSEGQGWEMARGRNAPETLEKHFKTYFNVIWKTAIESP